MKVNGVEVMDCVGCSESEIREYIRHVESKTGGALSKLAIRLERAGTVALEYEVLHRRFERIRRITGYLVGTINRWNNAKKAEERDRVKHI